MRKHDRPRPLCLHLRALPGESSVGSRTTVKSFLGNPTSFPYADNSSTYIAQLTGLV